MEGGGPLAGIKVIELAGAGGAPFACMLLADMGADVLRIDRPHAEDRLAGEPIEPRFNVMKRGRRSVILDLKAPAGREALLRLVAHADVLIEAYRPGVAERLGFGPQQCAEINDRLVYGRITGWGQDGPLAQVAGHDINFIALAGVLDAIGPANSAPVPPLNLLGDFGGGALYLVIGVLCALLERARSGKGQVVDAAMVDGAASMMSVAYGLLAAGRWNEARGQNLFDGGAPWYSTYETADGKFVCIGPFEAPFFRELMARLGVAPQDVPDQFDRASWPMLARRLQQIFRTRTRDDWAALLQDLDVCFTPVLPMREAIEHPHNVARSTFITVDGVTQPAPAPRLSRTPGRVQAAPVAPGRGADDALRDWGLDDAEIASLRHKGAFGTAAAANAAKEPR
jgi:alpha-methylacyl-CoA racemase